LPQNASRHWTYQVLSSFLTHEASECDDRRNAGEVEKDDGREALRIQAVKDVAFEQSVSTLHVIDHAAEEPASKKLSNQSVLCPL